MNTHADKTQDNKSQSVANAVSQKKSGVESTFQFVDNRPEAVVQRKLQEMANNNPQAKQLRAFQDMVNNSPQAKQATQLQAMMNKNSVHQRHPIQKKENNTGLPDNLKTGVENLSGYSMDDVKVHYNSDKPTQLQAHAYAQGTDIHLASGQEKHLPHEAWHVVQQKQGRVKPTVQMKGNVNINDDAGLEKEADMMGAKAVQFRSTNLGLAESSPITSNDLPIQRMPMDDFREFQGEWDAHSAEGWNLDSEQAGVGHGAARHVDIDALGLMARLATGDTNGNPASMFFDSPWDLLAEILNENKGKINEWIEANTGGLVLRKEVSNLKVLVYDEASGGKGKFTPHVGDAKVIMVLNRTNTGVAANPREYYLVTAFPLVGVDYQEMSHNERRSAKNKEKKKKVSKGQKKHNKKEEKRIAKAVDKRLG